MKKVLFFCLGISLFGADIQRFEGIVEEVAALKNEYETCNAKLLEREEMMREDADDNSSNLSLHEKIKELEESLQAKDILANIQAREIVNLQQKNEQILKSQAINPSPQNSNPFPPLMMKKEKEKER